MSSKKTGGMWFERVFTRVGLPFLVGVALIGVAPLVVLLPVSYYAAGLWSDFPGAEPLIPYVAIITVFLTYATRYMRIRLENVVSYADSLMAGEPNSDMSGLYGWRGVAATYLVLMTVVQTFYLLFQLPKSYTLLQAMTVSAAFFYWNVFINTFIWVFVYSMLRM